MSFLITALFTGIGLSMDAFSLAIAYGTLGLSRRKIWVTSIVVGIYHFFMPLFGYLLGNYFLASVIAHGRFLVGAIFTILALEMLISVKKDEEPAILKGLPSILFFGLTVSLDSFSVGLGFGALKINMLIPALVYALVSATFTFFGLKLGKKLSDHFGKLANIIGGIILLLLAAHYFF